MGDWLVANAGVSMVHGSARGLLATHDGLLSLTLRA